MTQNNEEIAPPKSSPLLFVVSGPSGVGKDALLDQLKSRDPNRTYPITATTRAPRPGEVDGVHYHYYSDDRFKEMIDHGELLEYAQVYDHYYGVPKSELSKGIVNGQDVIVKVDIQGAATIKRLIPQAITIFIAPSTMDELLQRQSSRQTETPAELMLRMETAKQEIGTIPEFDYLVTNTQGELDKAVAQVESIIAAEKSRVHPRLFSL